MQHSPAQQALAWLAAPSTEKKSSPRTLLLAAHPDDETIGAAAALNRLTDVLVVYLTDGSPREARFRSPHVSGSRDFYACVRAEEAACALALVNIPAERIVFLGGVDQESILNAPDLLQALLKVETEFQPSIVITHPYEGGHPDHDTAALIAHLAGCKSGQQNSAAARLLEMTSYHMEQGTRVSGQFLASDTQVPDFSINLKLTQEERATKARMLGCYVSQWHLLSEFPLEPERLRIAPSYDFTQSPHPGQLWYEYLNWPLTGAKWREAATKILELCGEIPCR